MEKIAKMSKGLGAWRWVLLGVVTVVAVGGTAIATLSDTTAPATASSTTDNVSSVGSIDFASLEPVSTVGSIGVGGAAGGGGGGAAGGGADILVAQY